MPDSHRGALRRRGGRRFIVLVGCITGIGAGDDLVNPLDLAAASDHDPRGVVTSAESG